MKKLAIITLAVITIANTASAEMYWSTPRLGGGYNYYGSDGYSGWSSPRLGGGYKYYDNKGSFGWSSPRLGGGYNFYLNK